MSYIYNGFVNCSAGLFGIWTPTGSLREVCGTTGVGLGNCNRKTNFSVFSIPVTESPGNSWIGSYLCASDFLIVCAVALGYAVLYFWRRRNLPEQTEKGAGFRPRIGFSRLDGMVSLSLLLENRSSEYVWAEEIEIFLSGLTAQTRQRNPSFREVQKVRQMVRSGDTLPISLSQVIYKAAGDPQRKYSCVMSSILRYRIGEQRLEKHMETYRLQMLGLTASGIQRERKPVPPFQPLEKSQDLPAAATELK